MGPRTKVGTLGNNNSFTQHHRRHAVQFTRGPRQDFGAIFKFQGARCAHRYRHGTQVQQKHQRVLATNSARNAWEEALAETKQPGEMPENPCQAIAPTEAWAIKGVGMSQDHRSKRDRTPASKSGIRFFATEAKSNRSANRRLPRSPISARSAGDMVNH